MQAYSDPRRKNDPHALPDIEVFEVWRGKSGLLHNDWMNDDGEPCEPGWYWWACFPGCLPDSDPFGPFATEAEALADAQENALDETEEDAR